MATKEIKQRITLEGEQQYNKAIKEAQRNLRTLRSELNAETAELGKNATEQQKNEARVKSLKKQIEEQEKVVQTLRAALQEARDNYGDNADVVQKWEQKLNDARATLAGMKNDLEANSAAANASNKSIMETFDKIAGYGETVSGAIEGIFSNCLGIVKSISSAVYGEITDLAARANNLSDLAGYWNTDPTTIQKWQAAVRGSANELEDLNTVVQKINFGDENKIAELTGVSAANYKDQWEYAMSVMDSMANMSYDQKSKAAEAIFGRSTTKAYELLNDWQQIQELLPRFDVEAGGIGMTAEQIEQMNQASVNLATLQTTWEEFKRSFEAGAMGQLAVDLTSNAQGVLDALISFMDAKNKTDREAALDKLQEELTEFFTRIGEAITAASEALDKVGSELQTSDNGLLRVMGRIISGISGLLDSLSKEETFNNILNGFRMLADFWLFGKGAQLVKTVAGLASNLGKITGFHFGNSGSNPTIPTTQPTVDTGAGANSGAGGWSGIAAALSSAAAKVIGGAAAFVLTLSDTEGIVPFSGSRNTEHYDQFVDKNGQLEQWAKDEGYVLLEDGSIWNPNEPTATEKEGQRIKNRETKYIESSGLVLPAKHTPQGVVKGYDLTPEQREAAENWWDVYKLDPMGDTWSKAWDNMESAFAGYEDSFDGLMDTITLLEQSLVGSKLYTEEDLPSFLFSDFTGNIMNSLQKLQDKPGITSDDIAKLDTLPARIEAAVSKGVSNIKVSIDGYPAGRVLAPYISQEIARSIIS